MFSTLNLYLECTIDNSNDTINSFETISSVFIFSIYQYDIIKKSYYIDNYKCLHTSYLKYKLFRFKPLTIIKFTSCMEINSMTKFFVYSLILLIF